MINLQVPLSDGWLKAMEYYTHPARGDVVAVEVTRLRTLTAKRKEGEFDMELSIGAITEELCDYPEDIVRTVCREWARKNIFFPVLKELLDSCEKFMILRRALLTQAKEQKFIDFKKKQPDYIDPVKDNRDRISELVKQALKNCGEA